MSSSQLDRVSTGPIVIGSAPSSGSTLLRVVLGRLPSVRTGGELHVMDRPELFGVEAATLQAEFAEWMRRGWPQSFVSGAMGLFSHAEDFGWQREELIDAGVECQGWHELLQIFFERALIDGDARRWLEKTPGNVFGFHRALEAFPNARFIHLVRDGRDVVASLMRRGHSPFRAASRWMVSVMAGLRLETLACTTRVRYEDLVIDPDGTLRQLCEVVGDCYDPVILQAAATEATPAVSSWLLPEQGRISAGAVGAYRRADTDVIHAYLRAIRLSEAGQEFLAALPGGDGPPNDLSGLDLLQLCGYECDQRSSSLALPETVGAAAEQEYEAYHQRQVQRFGPGRYILPTRLVGLRRGRQPSPPVDLLRDGR